MALRRRLYVGADPTVPQQVHRRSQQRADQRIGRQLLLGHAQPFPDFRADRNGLVQPRIHAAPGGNPVCAVVGPARARLAEQPAPFGETGLFVRIRVEKDVLVVERGLQADVAREQHPVAEHVAAHVADPDHGERVALDVPAHLPEMALDALPGALGRDPHALVVVSHRAAGGERVAQPESVFPGDRVGRVGEGGRALVGSNHQIRVVSVVPDHTVRRVYFVFIQIIGNIQQPVDKTYITRDAFGLQCVPASLHRGPFEYETALGAHRDDHRVLDVLGLHQAQHLGPEILPAVRPTQAAAGDHAAPQVDALESR